MFDTVMKILGFLICCFVWVVGGLTFLGPRIGARFYSDVNDPTIGGPTLALATLDCPAWLAQNDAGEIVAHFVNHSGRSLNYQVVTGFSPLRIENHCDMTIHLANGETGTAACTTPPMGQYPMLVHVAAWAEDENHSYYCEPGCPNSYQSTCTIMPDPLFMLSQTEVWVTLTGIIVAGLVVFGVGVLMWRGMGGVARGVILFLFIISLAMLSVAVGFAYGPWLAPVLLVGTYVIAFAIAGRLLQRRIIWL